MVNAGRANNKSAEVKGYGHTRLAAIIKYKSQVL